MDKKKIILTSLASVAMLGSAFIASQPSVVKAAEETTAQNEILANFDQALEETIKELEEEAKNDPGSAESIKETIAKLKAEAAKERAKIEDGFKTGKTAEATENEIEEIAKKEEAEEEEAAKQKKEIEDGFKNGLTVEEAEKAIDDANKKAAEEAKAEAEAKAKQDEFLANYDKALEEAVKELEKAETNSPEEAKAKADTIAALKAASDATRKQIVEGFEKGLTVEEAEKLIDKANEKAAEEDKEAAAKEEAAQKEFLANYDAALKAAIAELEKADTKNDPELEKQKQEVIEKLKEEAAKKRSDFVKRFKEGLTAKEAEKELDAANKKAEETTNPAPAEENKPAEQPKSEKGEALVQEELPEYPEIKKVGDSTGSPTKEEGRQSDNTAVNEPALVPKTPSAPGTDASATPTAETPSTPAVAPTVAGTSQDNTYQAPAAKADDKKELPNTGGKDNVAIASLGFLGLLLGALPFVKRKN